VMKPKPFSELNHFTVPVATCDPSFLSPFRPESCRSGAGRSSRG
jgi:hypothetical protein